MRILIVIAYVASFFTPKAIAGLHPSILMFNEWDFKNCPKQAKKVIDLNARKVNLVPTLHFIPNDDLSIKNLCMNSTNKRCESIDHQILARLKSYWKNCFKVLIENNIKIMITPHLDDGSQMGLWRNKVLFDPLKKYSGEFSYYETVIKPMIDALKDLNQYKLPLEFSMQGEMGATLFYAPNSYKMLKNTIKTALKNSKVGFSLNYNHINGDYQKFNTQNIQSLVNHMDFIGVSAYRPIYTKENQIADQPFKNTVLEFIEQFKDLGITIPLSKKIVFSEVGIGGGSLLNDGFTFASDIYEMAQAPHSGIFQYQANPWARKDFFQFRRAYYKKLDQFLSYQFFKFFNPVIDAYIWNADSWDVLGIYPKSEKYKDDYIINNYLTSFRSQL